ncbi:hypothetical protein F5Y15DRAFT_412655 [Xylariaceae sp. FL0016]|nr:hypothetical protein F5Y15DRAFT_412655 [Xylariaceae sp. FL0016]
MPTVDLEYPKQPYSKVNRYDVRASYALETIHQIVNTCPILHVSFTTPTSPFPMVLPMIGQMGSFARPSADTGDVLELYLHGYVSSRIMNLSRQNEETGARGEEQGMPITVAASHMDGLVLSLTPNSHSYNYRSAVLFGHAQLVADPAEKLYAMELITDGVVPGRWRHTRVPPNGAELSSTAVLRVRVAAGSAKIRSGMPSDEKADMADEAVTGRVWTGVVPVSLQMGEPMAGPYNVVAKTPAYIEDWRTEMNGFALETAVKNATKKMKGKSKTEKD